MKEKWLDRLDLPDEAAPGQVLVEIIGSTRVLIEHHRGVCAYGSRQICVRVQFGIVSVSGQCLELKRMTRGQLVITGKIDAICLERNK
jgi:sporulation protein YqfC